MDPANWEFPPELDEFLEFCVEEHNGDFDAISREFLEVASGLDDQLAGRAEEAFSASSLRQRYLQLHPEAQRVVPAAAAAAPATPAPSVTATEMTEATVMVEEDHGIQEEMPSQFSVLTDSLQDRVRRIYNNVQLRLPSAYHDGSDANSDADEAQVASARHSEGDDVSEDGDLKEAAVRLFGTTHLGSVVADLSTGANGGAGATNGGTVMGSPQKVEERDRDPSGLIARALRGEDESSEDSAVDDFRAMRKAVKESSQQAAADLPPKPSLVRKLRCSAPKAKSNTAAPGKGNQVTPGFVRLELVESTSEEEEEEEEDGASEDEMDHDSHLRVLSRLESSAPSGECPWDIWLQVTRTWPQLKAKLNSPDFCRQNGDLCVNFDVQLLKKLIEEEKEQRAAARQARMEDQENQKHRVNEYIQEAERRREMIKGRIGGFLLAPRNEKLEETIRRSEAKISRSAEVFDPPPRVEPNSKDAVKVS